MSAPVFVLDSASAATVGGLVTLEGSEAKHAGTVMRLQVGEAVDVVDGLGTRASGHIHSVTQGRVEVEVSSLTRDADAPVTLVQALAKGGRDEQAVETATELGVTAVVPWAASRSIVQWKNGKEIKGRQAWQAVAFAASKQSRRAFVPVVGELVSTKQLAAAVAKAVDSGERVLVLHEAATISLTELEWSHADQPVWLIVGPEGGIADEEREALEAAGAKTVVLGPHVLRASTAGPAAIAAIAALRGAWSASASASASATAAGPVA